MEKQNNKTDKLTDKAFSRLVITSVIGILVCIACLCSTTFAWFTGATESNTNTVISGNFDLIRPVVVFDGDAAEKLLYKAIATLPDKQRLVFNMRYFDEMPYAQMSEIVGTSEGALKASYHLAVKKVEQYILDHR